MKSLQKLNQCVRLTPMWMSALDYPRNMRFIIPPPVPRNIAAHWILYPLEEDFVKNDSNRYHGGIIIGDPCKIQDFFMGRAVWYLDINTKIYLEDINDIIHKIEVCMRDEDKIIYITDSSNIKRVNAIDVICCFLKSWFYFSYEEIYSFVTRCLKTRISSPIHRYGIYSSDMIERYKRPLKVLVCGDRRSSTSFEEHIDFELKSLPPYSIIIHGGCQGIDSYAHQIALSMGFEVKIYPARWDDYGKAAGPIRNKEMLDKEDPDLVLAFHPDIEESKGTKNMILQAYNHININTTKISPDVYINSLKRKTSLKEHFGLYGYGDFSHI